MTTQDNDSTEQPVREQLRKTTIAATYAHSQAPPSTTSQQISEPLRKKRSFDDIESAASGNDTANKHTKQHTRKRSRDSVAGEDDLRAEYKRTSHDIQRDVVEPQVSSNGDAHSALRPATPELQTVAQSAEGDIASPKIKRSRLQDGGTEQPAAEDTSLLTNGSGENRNTKATDALQTSHSAFAASGFGALSSSTSSGFGALGKLSGGFGSGKGFASASSEPRPKSDGQNGPVEASSLSKDTTSPSAFGGALGAKSAFASVSGSNSSSSAFGGFGKSSGFGSGSGFSSLSTGAPLPSFASKTGSAPFGSQKTSKAFGAPAEENVENADDDGDDDGDDSGVKSPLSVGTDEDRKDSRFFEQVVETGEEGEELLYQSRAKLYNFAENAAGKKEWKERGIGVLRLNVSKPSEDDAADGEKEAVGKLTARLLIRADGSHRVLLNSPVKKGIKFAHPQGGPPTAGQMTFMGTIDGKIQLELLQVKVGHSHRL